MERRETPGGLRGLPLGLILGLRGPPLAVAARQKDGIASSVPRRALGNPVRVRTGRKGEEAPPGAPPQRSLSDRRTRSRPAPRYDGGARLGADVREESMQRDLSQECRNMSLTTSTT